MTGTAVELAALIRNREVSPVEVVQAALDRIDRLDPDLRAFVTVDYEGALAAAREAERSEPAGPLHGVPVAVKDLSLTRGLRTTFGSLLHRDFVPDQDSVSVERLRAAGAILVGKTNTPEFGYKGVTDNRLGPPTVNPWNRERTAGGSSGGSAAAVAAGLVPLAEGTDGAGSIRIPACFCGVVGLKPTFGRVPRHPVPDLYYTLSHTGPIACTVADAALMLEVLAGPDSRDPWSLDDFPAAREPRRVAWSPDLGYAQVEPEVARVAREAVARLPYEVEEADPGFPDPEEVELGIWRTVYAARFGPLPPEVRERMDPLLAAIVDEGMAMPAWELAKQSLERTRLWETLERFFGRYDLLVTPTMPVEAFPASQQRPDTVDKATLFGWTPFTYPFNLTGLPAVTVPAGLTRSGLPVGLQIVGRRGADRQVLLAAAAFERAAPWSPCVR